MKTFFRILACLCITPGIQSVFAAQSATAESSLAPVDRATFGHLIEAASAPMDNAAFLQLLRAEKRCHDPGGGFARFYPSCRDRLLSALDMLEKPTDAVLVETLDWYWSSKKRTGTNEMMQRRLFNRVQLPLFRAVLMENRYLQSAVEFRSMQYRLDPFVRESWGMSPYWGRAQSINELFHLTYALPEDPGAFSDGYSHQDRVFGSPQLNRLSGRSPINRLLGHVVNAVGDDPFTDRYNATPAVPGNPAFWKSVQRLDYGVRHGVRWKALMQPLEEALKNASQRYAQWLQYAPDVASMYRPGQSRVFIEYLQYRDTRSGDIHYAAFRLSALNPRETTRFADLGAAQDIDALVDELRRGILQQTDIEPQRKKLAALLLKPLSLDVEKIDELVISPVAGLNRLPFSLLVRDGEKGGPLVSFNDRGSILVQQFWREAGLDQPVATSPGIVLAAPAYGGNLKTVAADLDVAGLERKGSTAWPRFFTPLANTLQEGRRIADMSPDEVVFLSGDAAGEFALFERDNPDFIHIAGHGYFLSSDWQRRTDWPRRRIRGAANWYNRDPGVLPRLNSGLALAGANQLVTGAEVRPFRQDGLFTASDAAMLNLLGTRLVVLSACDTGLGSSVSVGSGFGDGVSDLRTAFGQAGAQNVVMSLWPVADRTTGWLMEDFYRAWFSGVPPKLALRQANTRLRERLREKGLKDRPYYWAAFVIQGEY